MCSEGSARAVALLDDLDRQGVPGELLEHLAAMEEEALWAARLGGEVPLPPEVRCLALRFMQYLALEWALPWKTWLEASALLDLWCLRTSGAALLEYLPATCAAVMRLLRNVEDSAIPTVHRELAAQAVPLARLTELLGNGGIVVAETTEEHVAQQEKALLTALHWQITFPTMESWMSTFICRFNIMTDKVFAPALQLIFLTSAGLATTIVMRRAASPGLPPRKAAAGIISLGFISVQLLPLEAVQPASVSEEAWEQSLSTIFQNPQANVPVPAHSHCVLKMLHLATMSTSEELREACGLVTMTLTESAGI